MSTGIIITLIICGTIVVVAIIDTIKEAVKINKERKALEEFKEDL